MTDIRNWHRVQEPTQYEDLSQALYDVAHVPSGVPLQQLMFFGKPMGANAKLLRNGMPGDHIKLRGDTNAAHAGVVAYGRQRITGIVHRLRCNPWHASRARSWWTTASQGAHFELRLIDKPYLDLPLDAVPLLEPFESPFARWHETIEEYDDGGVLTKKTTRIGPGTLAWPLEIPLILETFQNFLVAITFVEPFPTPGIAFDVEMILLGEKQRPSQ